MSSHYTTEPPPTASVLLHTTAGPLTLSLFAAQTPLTCRNFLQHVLDEDYTNNLFHRVAPGFVIQTGDPTGTGEGGQNIYEDREFERYDEDWSRVMGREKDEKIVFGDEIHSRLKFNRRGLVGMAKGTGAGGGYGSQFFITLGDCRAELDGKCTMFGRVEGDGIYNVVKVAEGELLDGSERPMYPEKILKVEIIELPKGDAWQKMRKRQKVADRFTEAPTKKKFPKKKAGKALLSFGGDEGDDGDIAVRPKKAKFNPALIEAEVDTGIAQTKTNGTLSKPQPGKRDQRSPSPTIPAKRKANPAPSTKSPSPVHRRQPSFHDPTTQLPLKDPESPSRSPTPDDHDSSVPVSKTSALQAEIDALKASMRRNIDNATTSSKHKKFALESLIPATSTRGRKRPRPGETNSTDDAKALKMLDAFRARLDSATDQKPAATSNSTSKTNGSHKDGSTITAASPPIDAPVPEADDDDDDEAALCDLHFIANCQSCSKWDDPATTANPDGAESADEDGNQWLSHSLSFAKDRLGKDLTWKRKNEEELVVIDPREREREIKAADSKRKDRDKGKGKARKW